VFLTYTVVSPDGVSVVSVPTSTEFDASDENAHETIATSLSLQQKGNIICQFEVDFSGRAIPAISTGVIQRRFVLAP
jgi:hypothetical protein